MKEIIAWIAGILVFFALLFGLQYWGLINYQFFAPKYEAARRDVYENTQSYHQGSVRDFDNLYLAYVQSKDENEKAVLLETMRHRASGVTPDSIPPRVQALLNQ